MFLDGPHGVTWARRVKRPACRATSPVSYHWPVFMHHLRRLPMKPNIGPQVTARHPVESRHFHVRSLAAISLEHIMSTTTLPGSCGVSWTTVKSWDMTCRRMQKPGRCGVPPGERGHSLGIRPVKAVLQGQRGMSSCPMLAGMLPTCR